MEGNRKAKAHGLDDGRRIRGTQEREHKLVKSGVVGHLSLPGGR